MPRQYFDVTLPYSARLPAWPGEPKPRIDRLSAIARGAAANVTRIAMAVHFGTHLDAPLHFIEGAGGVETLAVETLIGPVLVADTGGTPLITAERLDALELPARLERILFKTRNSTLWDDLDQPFVRDYVAIAADGARWLVARGARLVGIDYLSVEPFDSPGFPTHKILLGAGVIAVEGLDLRRVAAGAYEMACLPMKIVGADGAPARVVLWRDADSPPAGR